MNGVKVGINDIKTKRPDIAEFMNNYNLYYNIKNENNPALTSFSGNAEVYCRCNHGHDFHQMANKLSRKKQVDGYVVCPICKKEGIVKIPYVHRKTWKVSLYDFCNKNSEYKHLLDEWDYDKNIEVDIKCVAKGSNMKVHWICPNGHSYKSKISKRTVGGGCPFCNRRTLLVGFNDLESQYPEISKEWDYEANFPLCPKDVFAHADKVVHWKCCRGHKWRANINKRTGSQATGCPYCKNHGTSLIETILYLCLKSKFQKVVHRKKIENIEFDIFIEDIPLGIEYDGSYFHERRKSEKENRDKQKDKKAKEKGFKFLRVYETQENDLHKVFKNNTLYWGVNKNTKYEDLCREILRVLNEKYNINVSEEVKEDVVIQARKVLNLEFIENSLAVKSPEVAEEWHPTKNQGLTPNSVTNSSHFNAWWKCKNGHTYQKQVSRRTYISKSHKGGCPYCEGARKLNSLNSFAVVYKELLKYWDDVRNRKEINIRPNELIYSANVKVYMFVDGKSVLVSLQDFIKDVNKEQIVC